MTPLTWEIEMMTSLLFLSKRRLLIALLFLTLATRYAKAQEPESQTPEVQTPEVHTKDMTKVTYGFETDFNSRYVWRGIALSQGPVEQTTAWVSISGFTFYTWGNMAFKNGPQRGGFNQGEFSV